MSSILLAEVQHPDLWTWCQTHPNGYEVSSVGDQRFSPLYAVLPDGRTIEEAYQLDVKGYRERGVTNWLLVKGKPPVHPVSQQQLFFEFLQLWDQYLNSRPGLLAELFWASRTKRVLTDRFAKTPVNQAAALAALLNSYTYGI